MLRNQGNIRIWKRTTMLVRCYSGLSKRESVHPSKSTSNITRPPIHRVTYEYPPPPKPIPEVPKESSTWKRHVPLIAGLGGLLWASYAIYYFFGDNSKVEQSVLSPSSFTTYRITYKEAVSSDTELIELSPKYAAGAAMLKSGSTIWNGKRIWSVQIKHPLIQIARSYTPLPIYFMRSDRPDDPPLMRMMGKSVDEGRMTLLVKRYKDGEMSSYLHSLPVGSDVELRGPYTDVSFKYEAADQLELRQAMLDNPSRMAPEPELESSYNTIRPGTLAMFTAGTGITTALQVLLSPHNPPHGFVNVYHSARTRAEIPFERFRLFLESTGRAKFHIFVDEESNHLTSTEIPSLFFPQEGGACPPPQAHSLRYNSAPQQFAQNKDQLELSHISHAVVCGPPGYITYVAGNPGLDGKGPIAGLLGSKGWNADVVDRMYDL